VNRARGCVWVAILAGLAGWAVAGCALRPSVAPARTAAPPPPPAVPTETWRESPVPDGVWRPHVLSRCQGEDRASPEGEKALSQSFELFRMQSGSDAIMELEISLRRRPREGLVLLQLAQLYLMAGQGEPELLPREGPARDVGDWPRNRERLLGRAELLLGEAQSVRPEDGVIDYLQGDVQRARGDSVGALRAVNAGRAKCLPSRSMELLRRFQHLNGRAAKLVNSVAPVFPPDAVRAGVGGEVVLDLLISPAGAVVQTVTVRSPDARLTAAAAAALHRAEFEPARLGKYPIWSWIRIPTQFKLAGG
jgi:TonB family protein